jgi:hypothetical protein
LLADFAAPTVAAFAVILVYSSNSFSSRSEDKFDLALRRRRAISQRLEALTGISKLTDG